MLKRNRTRAARRNAERQRKNRLAREKETEPTPTPARARKISQLELLLSRGNITPKQYKAGDQLYLDWRLSGSEPRLVPAYDREIGLGGGDVLDHQLDARARFESALQAVGQRYRDVVVHVCLLDCPIGDYPRLTVAEAMDRLKIGLSNLTHWHDNEGRTKVLDYTSVQMVRP